MDRFRWVPGATHYKYCDHDWPGAFGNMDIISHEVIWDHLKEFDMNGRISCGPLTVDNAEAAVGHRPRIQSLPN